MKIEKLIFCAALSLSMGRAEDHGVAPADLLKPLKDSWPTYSGDYTGKRYSALTEINQSNVSHLSLAWMRRVTPGSSAAAPSKPARSK